MNCSDYQNLSIQEQREMIGKVVHILQNSNTGFEMCRQMILAAEATGVLENVVINPPKEVEN